ncbi:hypothetical protein Drorol1_Dr00003567 [Drosera rotundifolia]
MSADSSDVSRRSRPVLSDVTNQPRKGGFSVIPCSPTKLGKRDANKLVCEDNNKLPVKRAAIGVENVSVVRSSSDDKEKNCPSIPVKSDGEQQIRGSGAEKESGSSVKEVLGEVRNSQSGLKLVDMDDDYAPADRVSLGGDNAGAGISAAAKSAKRVTESGLLPLKGGKAYKLLSHGNSSVCSQDSKIGIAPMNHKIENRSVFGIDSTQENVPDDVTEGGKYATPKENFISTPTLSDGVGNKPGEKCGDDEGRELETARCGSTKETSAVGLQSTKLKHRQPFELTRCTVLEDEGCSSLNAETKSLKGCSCSFCMKAAFIWSDLQLQDVKGRVSASVKSRREASNLARKVGESTNVVNTEADLMKQWKYFFSSMEEIFLKESKQLESSFFSLKEISENCKKNLETTHGVLVEVQTCLDASTDLMNTR